MSLRSEVRIKGGIYLPQWVFAITVPAVIVGLLAVASHHSTTSVVVGLVVIVAGASGFALFAHKGD